MAAVVSPTSAESKSTPCGLVTMIAELRSVACFNHIDTVEPITVGLSSQCYRVSADNQVFFAKQITDDTETTASLLAAKQGLSPPVYFHNTQWLITYFITAINLADSAAPLDTKITTTLNLMTRCHLLPIAAKPLIPGTIINELLTKIALSSQQKNHLITTVQHLKLDHSADVNHVFCHGDVNFSNIVIASTKQAWLVDWECACSAPAEFDLAMFIAVNNIPADRLPSIVNTYQQQNPASAIKQALLTRYLLFCYLLNGLWYYHEYQQTPEGKTSKLTLKNLATQQWSSFDALAALHGTQLSLKNLF